MEKQMYKGHELKNVKSEPNHAQNKIEMERQAKELNNGVYVRCRNLSIPLLSREIKQIKMEVILNAKIMKRSNHITEDEKLFEKILAYCKKENKNINKLRLEHLPVRDELQKYQQANGK